jgi:cytochrome c biogenesis protein
VIALAFKDQFQETAHAPFWTPAGFWQRLSSMRFALWLLLIIALGSVLGVIVGNEYPTNVMGWRELAAKKAGPVLFHVLDFFQMFDAFRSWWYRLLLGALSLSLLACIIKRSRGAWKRAMKATFLEQPEYYERYDQRATCRVKASEPFAALGAPLRKRLFRLERRPGPDGSLVLAAHRGGVARFGPILTHCGLLFLVVGGLVSAVAGLKTHVWLAPGDEIDSLDRCYFAEESSDASGNATGAANALVPLGFDLRLDDFEIQYNDQGMIKQYLSTVTVTPKTGEPFRQVISVNHPLRLAHFNFYQASYQTSYNSVRSLQIAIQDSTRADLVEPFEVALDEPFDLPIPGLHAVASRFFGHAMVGEGGIYNASFEHQNPAVLIEVYQGEEELWHQWAFARFRDMHMGQNHPLNFVVLDYEPDYLTGLEITRESATWLMWAGFSLCTLGLLLSFTIAHRQIWALALPDGPSKWRVSVAAWTNRDSSLLGREFERWAQSWRKSGEIADLRLYSRGEGEPGARISGGDRSRESREDRENGD